MIIDPTELLPGLGPVLGILKNKVWKNMISPTLPEGDTEAQRG